jgi:hypothetical protein
MLLSILDLDAITVDDIMVTRQDIVGLDLDRARDPSVSDALARSMATCSCNSGALPLIFSWRMRLSSVRSR